jgi:uncharacterized membrane protein
MRATIFGILALGLLVLGNVILALAYYASLPDRVVSEFDAAGVAVGSQPKVALFLTHLGVVLGMALGVVPLLYLLMRFCPAWMIDMPHKDHWLAEPRQRETRRTAFCYVLWMMDFTLGFLTALFWLMYRANLAETPRLGQGFWLCLAVFLIATAVWLVRFYRRFRVPKEDSPSEPAQ